MEVYLYEQVRVQVTSGRKRKIICTQACLTTSTRARTRAIQNTKHKYMFKYACRCVAVEK